MGMKIYVPFVLNTQYKRETYTLLPIYIQSNSDFFILPYCIVGKFLIGILGYEQHTEIASRKFH